MCSNKNTYCRSKTYYCFALLAFTSSYFSLAAEPRSFPVAGYSVTDGDTIDVTLDLGFRIYYSSKLRVHGIDTPEKSTAAGRAIKSYIEHWLKNKSLSIVYVDDDKYGGRFLGNLIVTPNIQPPTAPISLAEHLIKLKMARPYAGDKKVPWTVEELRTAELAVQGLIP
jgi:endonuclease YncB( thermonuclease family)